MRELPDDLDDATKAVRAGVRLALNPSKAVIRDASAWERFKAFGRRQLMHARARLRPDRGGSGDEIVSQTSRGKRAVRLGEHDVLVRTPYGWLIVPAEDELLLANVMDGGVLEPGTTRVLTHLIREGDTVVDVGANIGLMTIPAARRVGPRGKVIAFEPLPRLADALLRSVHINGLGQRVQIEVRACAQAAGAATLHVGSVLGHSSLLPLEGEVATAEVALCAVDDVVPAGVAVSLVKIDAEGFETNVWGGMRRILAENRELAAIVEFGPSHLARAGMSVPEWLAAFTSQGFSAYEIDELSGRCTPLRSTGLEDIVSMNLLWLREAPSRYPDIEFA